MAPKNPRTHALRRGSESRRVCAVRKNVYGSVGAAKAHHKSALKLCFEGEEESEGAEGEAVCLSQMPETIYEQILFVESLESASERVGEGQIRVRREAVRKSVCVKGESDQTQKGTMQISNVTPSHT